MFSHNSHSRLFPAALSFLPQQQPLLYIKYITYYKENTDTHTETNRPTHTMLYACIAAKLRYRNRSLKGGSTGNRHYRSNYSSTKPVFVCASLDWSISIRRYGNLFLLLPSIFFSFRLVFIFFFFCVFSSFPIDYPIPTTRPQPGRHGRYPRPAIPASTLINIIPTY